jgi:hypothetical protein
LSRSPWNFVTAILGVNCFVEASVRLSRPRTPSRVIVSVSSRPSRSEAAAPGCEWQLTGEQLQALEHRGVIVERPRLPKPAARERAIALGQVLEDVRALWRTQR